METMQLSKTEKINLGTREISKRIREQLKAEFKSCVFSVVTEYYSMGSSIHISLMESNFKVIKDFKDIPETALINYADNDGRTREQLSEMQNKKYHQLNCNFYEPYNPENWSNGVFLTEQGFNLFKRVMEIVNQYNYDESDIQTDYSDVNFYTDLSIGKWNKEYRGF